MEHVGNQAYSGRGRGARPGTMTGLRYGPLSLAVAGYTRGVHGQQGWSQDKVAPAAG